jgi:ABC-type lipoprotein export system ATPase subunit
MSEPAIDTAMAHRIVLETTNLSRVYRAGRQSVLALDGVSLGVRRGEFVTIMGPSGSGKSTLLNLVGGLDRPTQGRVAVNGIDLAGLSDTAMAALRRTAIGFVFQRHDLFPFLTARENVEFPMLLDDQPPFHRRAQADDLLALVGLSEKADYLPDELSGGQQQRVGIARALANQPTIVLADEPTGSLDSTTAAEILDMLMSLVSARALTLIMVTHVEEDAARADRVLRLRDGRLLEHGMGDAR